MSVSVLTIVKGRDAHLRNLMIGLGRQTVPPDEFLIVYMQSEPISDLPKLPFSVRQIFVEDGELPLAAARNLAARTARSDGLIFLDADCIPSPALVADYRRALGLGEAIYMGEVLYLPKDAVASGWTDAELRQVGVRHHERAPALQSFVQPCEYYQGFWSLSFAMLRTLFVRHGGFDEQFTGYGGEDTDFARRCVERGIPLMWCDGALAYHQHHPHHMPPVHHLRSVLQNNAVYRRKWGTDTMEPWLEAFEAMGLIEANGDGYHVLRQPNADDLALTAQQSHQPYASSDAVTVLLQNRIR